MEVAENLEKEFLCPFCGEPISMLLDLSVPAQTFVEDCEVCCRPIQVTYRVDDNEVTSFEVEREY